MFRQHRPPAANRNAEQEHRTLQITESFSCTSSLFNTWNISGFLKGKGKKKHGSFYLQKAPEIICAVDIEDFHSSRASFAHCWSQGAAARKKRKEKCHMRAKKEIHENFCFSISFSCLCHPIPTSPLQILLTIRIFFPIEIRRAQKSTQEIDCSSFVQMDN